VGTIAINVFFRAFRVFRGQKTKRVCDMATEFNWQNCWYPVVFLADLPAGKPYGFSLYGEPLLLFRDGQGRLACVPDRCPHRAARLSDGQIIDGKLECLYHGWQFNATGECVRIPQLPADKQIPAPACLKPYHTVPYRRSPRPIVVVTWGQPILPMKPASRPSPPWCKPIWCAWVMSSTCLMTRLIWLKT